mmetsp:Transcript_39990/g.46798  ORF Transcript_39990/g.46798 Transcript_39990/m.46798 type:complete len:85 (-) Transcript_39990:224-478(-)
MYSPASEPTAITVGSTTNTDGISKFSNYGNCVDVYGPGSSITAAWKNGGTRTISGTSMASPRESPSSLSFPIVVTAVVHDVFSC